MDGMDGMDGNRTTHGVVHLTVETASRAETAPGPSTTSASQRPPSSKPPTPPDTAGPTGPGLCSPAV